MTERFFQNFKIKTLKINFIKNFTIGVLTLNIDSGKKSILKVWIKVLTKENQQLLQKWLLTLVINQVQNSKKNLSQAKDML
jgi:hypothetical protein